MSGVKNLRAMFENKGDDPSPPDRGRSPGIPAIEKDGVIGLRRDPSYEPSPSRRPPSTDMETASNSSVIGADDTYKTPRKRFGNDPIPESPRDISAPIGRDAFQEKLAAVAEKSNSKPEKPVEEEPVKPVEKPEPVNQEPAKPEEKPVEKPVAAAAPITKPASAKPAVAATRARSNSPVKTSIPAEKAKPIAKKDASKENEKPKGQTRLAVAKPAVRKAASTIGLAAANKSAAPTKPAAKAQAGPTKSTPSTTAKPSDAKPTSRLAERAAARKPATTTTASSTNASKTTRPPPLKPTQASDTGFVKPKPKSPTKPVSLPASLTAPTASSVSKGNAARGQSKSSLQAPATTNRAPSRTSVTGSGTSSKPTKQSSTTTRSRPSLGVPPKKAEPEAAPRRESHVDESFLARMMRPTQASSSKTTEKVPLTPPKKTTHWVPSNGASGSRRSSSVRASTQPGSPSTARSVGSNAEDSSLLAVDESAVEIEEPEPAVPAPAKQTAKAVEVAPAKEPKIDAPKAEVKPEPEVEAKPEPKVEATPEPEVKPKVEIKSEPEPEIKVEPEVEEAKPEPEVEQTKPQPEYEEVKPEPEVEIKTEPEVEIKSEPEVKPTPEPEAKPEPVPEVEAKPEPEPEVEAKTEAEVEVKAEPDVESKAEPEVEIKTEAEAKPEVAITSDAEVKPEPQVPSADEKTADSTVQPDTGKDSISAPLPVEEEQTILTEDKKPEASEVSAVASS
ncbi:unnamed protein product [Clonostachys rosea f. rosea IK726]|uniref:Uncharacterized protein n=1 Tax=Clonostachys rosea f. rosea IK726 TaxID=1349383 RepID=A0ACA9UQB3_BIOOC|nr:unnamed protein product [Clonostachys rosea f. rosea IK726]